MRQELKVYACKDSMVPNYEALKQGHLRFIGRRLDPSLGCTKKIIDRGKEVEKKSGAWIVLDEIQTVPHRAEYLAALKKGDLLPADSETARLAGLNNIYAFGDAKHYDFNKGK